jgi:hypothetical protein
MISIMLNSSRVEEINTDVSKITENRFKQITAVSSFSTQMQVKYTRGGADCIPLKFTVIMTVRNRGTVIMMMTIIIISNTLKIAKSKKLY